MSVSDMDIKTLSKTELGSESSVSWRLLRTPFTGPPFGSSSLKFPIQSDIGEVWSYRGIFKKAGQRNQANANQ